MKEDLFCALCYVPSSNVLFYRGPVCFDDSLVMRSEYLSLFPLSQSFVVPYNILDYVLKDYYDSDVEIVSEDLSL